MKPDGPAQHHWARKGERPLRKEKKRKKRKKKKNGQRIGSGMDEISSSNLFISFLLLFVFVFFRGGVFFFLSYLILLFLPPFSFEERY